MIKDSNCLLQRFCTAKYLNQSKKEYDFLSENEWFKSTGDNIDKNLKNSLKEFRKFNFGKMSIFIIIEE